MKLSVVGEPQAHAAAAFASFNSGQNVGLYAATPDDLLFDEASHRDRTAPIRVTGSLLRDSDLFVVVSQSRTLKRVLGEVRHEIAGKSVLLAPGGFAGALRVAEWFTEWNLPAPRVAEVTGFLVAAQAKHSTYTFAAVKRNLPFAAANAEQTHEMLADYLPYFPDLVPSDLITTSLSNTNHMIHPCVVLLNAARIENGLPFRFYREGLSPSTADFLDAVDSERMELVSALGAEPLNLRDWMLRFYADQGMQGTDIVECLQTFPAFADTPSPPSLDYRYLADDVAFGIAQYLLLAQRLGTASENLQSLVSATTLLRGTPRTADEESARLFQGFLLNRTGVLS